MNLSQIVIETHINALIDRTPLRLRALEQESNVKDAESHRRNNNAQEPHHITQCTHIGLQVLNGAAKNRSLSQRIMVACLVDLYSYRVHSNVTERALRVRPTFKSFLKVVLETGLTMLPNAPFCNFSELGTRNSELGTRNSVPTTYRQLNFFVVNY